MSFEFCCQPRKAVENIFKKTVASHSVSEETRGSLKPVGTGSGIMYGLCNVCKDIVNNFPPAYFVRD